MVKRKERISLKDLKRTDEIENSLNDTKKANHDIEINMVTTAKTTNIDKNKQEDITNEQNEMSFEKLSVAVPTDMFELLQDISRQRRRAKKKHTISQMVREALNLWLEHRNQTNFI